MTEDLPVVGAIVHDLAGMLSNVAAFAGILESRPDHPSRAEFLPVMAKEARSATEALKDLQLARSLSAPWPRSELQRVDLRRVLREAGARRDSPAWLHATIETLGGAEVLFWADEGVFIGLLSRALDVASGGMRSEPPPLAAERSPDGPMLVLDLTHTSYEGDVAADVGRGRRELRAFALLRGVVESWGGASELVRDADALRLLLRLRD